MIGSINYADIVATVVSAAVVYILNEIRRYIASYHTDNAVMKAVLEGVQRAQVRIVAPAKAANGGTLTPTQQSQAESAAITHAIEVAPTQKIKELIQSWTAREASAVITQALARIHR